MSVYKRRYKDGTLSKDWWINYRIHGKQYKRKIGPNKKLAEQILHDIELKALRGEYLGIHEAKKITFADFLREYLAWARVNKGAKTYELNRFCGDRLREAFTASLAGLMAKQVEDYKVLRRQTVKPATVNRELAMLKHMCTKALEWGYLKVNPLKSVKFLKEPPGRLRYLTQDEMDALLAACSHTSGRLCLQPCIPACANRRSWGCAGRTSTLERAPSRSNTQRTTKLK